MPGDQTPPGKSLRGCGRCTACHAQANPVEGIMQKVCDGRKPDRLSMTKFSLCDNAIV